VVAGILPTRAKFIPEAAEDSIGMNLVATILADTEIILEISNG